MSQITRTMVSNMRDMLDAVPVDTGTAATPAPVKAKAAEALTFKAGPSLSEVFLQAAGLAGTQQAKERPAQRRAAWDSLAQTIEELKHLGVF